MQVSKTEIANENSTRTGSKEQTCAEKLREERKEARNGNA
jgi:hypothetical protein